MIYISKQNLLFGEERKKMKKKIVGIFVCTLLITSVLQIVANEEKISTGIQIIILTMINK